MNLAGKITTKILGNALLASLLFKKGQNQNQQIYYIRVDPNRIEYLSWFPSRTPLLRDDVAKVGIHGGTWDLFKSPFRNHLLYRSFEEMLSGTPLEDTIYYKKMKRGGMENQAGKITLLYKELRENGYLSQYELGETIPEKQIGPWRVPGNEIVVAMGRSGELIRIAGGRHRLAIAQQIDIPAVYAVLTLIHPDAAEKLPKIRREVTGSTEDFMPL
jgi:hypothetical protein